MRGKNLREFWKRLPYGENVHPDDRPILESRPHTLQTEVVPGLWYFNPATAQIYILMANPGAVTGRDLEFYVHGGELEILWRRKLAGEDVELEMLETNTRHGLAGNKWIRERLRGTIDSEVDILNKVCVLNLVPYRSTQSADYKRFVEHLPSANFAKAMVHDEILPRARQGEIMLVCVRDVLNWGLRSEPETATVRIGGISRGGHLTPGSSHGPAIREFLGMEPQLASDRSKRVRTNDRNPITTTSGGSRGGYKETSGKLEPKNYRQQAKRLADDDVIRLRVTGKYEEGSPFQSLSGWNANKGICSRSGGT